MQAHADDAARYDTYLLALSTASCAMVIINRYFIIVLKVDRRRSIHALRTCCPRREDSPMASPELAAVQSVRPRTASWSDGVPIIISLTAVLWGLDLRAGGACFPPNPRVSRGSVLALSRHPLTNHERHIKFAFVVRSLLWEFRATDPSLFSHLRHDRRSIAADAARSPRT